jgi:hypothetical protein
VDQQVWARGEPSVIGRESTSRYSVMPVRMGAPSAGPRMEPPDHPDPAADAPGIQRQFLSGLGCAPTAEVVEGLLVAAGQRSECIRKRAGDHAVRDWQQQTFWVVEPWRSRVLWALGTVPVLTGVVAVLVLLAGLTVIDLAAERLRAAPLKVLHGPQRPGRPPAAKCRAGLGAMDAAYRSALPHHRARMRRLMASAPSGAALAVRCVETLVVAGEWCPRDT